MIEKLKQILQTNGVEKYIPLLDAHTAADLNSLVTLEETDLENMGIMAMGDRKKIVKLFSLYREEACYVFTLKRSKRCRVCMNQTKYF